MRSAHQLLIFLLLVPCLAAADSQEPIPYEDFEPGLLAVKLADGTPRTDADVDALLKAAAPREVLQSGRFFGRPENMDDIALRLGLDRVFLVEVDETADHLGLTDELSVLPEVEWVDLNWIVRLQWTPNDPLFPDQWALEQMSDIDMDASAAWDVTQGSEDVIIAILDSGVNYNHEDLANKIWVNPGEDLNANGVIDTSDYIGIDDDLNCDGWPPFHPLGDACVDDLRGVDFVQSTVGCVDVDCDTTDNDPMDGFGHGTEVSGVAVAETDNGLGVASICPGCRVMPIRVCYDTATGGRCNSLSVMYGIYYASDNSADVINLSLGSTVPDCDSPSYDIILEYAHESGVVLVAAAGNYNTDEMFHPACRPEVIGVTALMADGTNPGGNYGDWVDVAAPGLSVHTTKVGGGYGTFSGTSAASPHVAGLAGLLLSVRPELTPDEVRQIIMDSSEPLDWPDTPIAAGRVNAYAALVETGVSEDVAAAMTARLRGNYPNPFNPVTRIEYELAARSRVSLSVYDLTGRRVRSLLASEQLDSGPHTTVWDGLDDSGRAVASGAYFYRLEAGTEALSRKMILVK